MSDNETCGVAFSRSNGLRVKNVALYNFPAGSTLFESAS